MDNEHHDGSFPSMTNAAAAQQTRGAARRANATNPASRYFDRNAYVADQCGEADFMELVQEIVPTLEEEVMQQKSKLKGLVQEQLAVFLVCRKYTARAAASSQSLMPGSTEALFDSVIMTHKKVKHVLGPLLQRSKRITTIRAAQQAYRSESDLLGAAATMSAAAASCEFERGMIAFRTVRSYLKSDHSVYRSTASPYRDDGDGNREQSGPSATLENFDLEIAEAVTASAKQLAGAISTTLCQTPPNDFVAIDKYVRMIRQLDSSLRPIRAYTVAYGERMKAQILDMIKELEVRIEVNKDAPEGDISLSHGGGGPSFATTVANDGVEDFEDDCDVEGADPQHEGRFRSLAMLINDCTDSKLLISAAVHLGRQAGGAVIDFSSSVGAAIAAGDISSMDEPTEELLELGSSTLVALVQMATRFIRVIIQQLLRVADRDVWGMPVVTIQETAEQVAEAAGEDSGVYKALARSRERLVASICEHLGDWGCRQLPPPCMSDPKPVLSRGFPSTQYPAQLRATVIAVAQCAAPHLDAATQPDISAALRCVLLRGFDQLTASAATQGLSWCQQAALLADALCIGRVVLPSLSHLKLLLLPDDSSTIEEACAEGPKAIMAAICRQFCRKASTLIQFDGYFVPQLDWNHVESYQVTVRPVMQEDLVGLVGSVHCAMQAAFPENTEITRQVITSCMDQLGCLVAYHFRRSSLGLDPTHSASFFSSAAVLLAAECDFLVYLMEGCNARRGRAAIEETILASVVTPVLSRDAAASRKRTTLLTIAKSSSKLACESIMSAFSGNLEERRIARQRDFLKHSGKPISSSTGRRGTVDLSSSDALKTATSRLGATDVGRRASISPAISPPVGSTPRVSIASDEGSSAGGGAKNLSDGTPEKPLRTVSSRARRGEWLKKKN